jgi:hypothetical protein
MECNAMSRSLAKLIGSMPDAAPAHGSMRAHMSTEEILEDIRLRIEWMPLECGPGVTIPALPPVDRHNPPKVKVYGGWKHFIMHVVLALEVSKASRRQVATTGRGFVSLYERESRIIVFLLGY